MALREKERARLHARAATKVIINATVKLSYFHAYCRFERDAAAGFQLLLAVRLLSLSRVSIKQ